MTQHTQPVVAVQQQEHQQQQQQTSINQQQQTTTISNTNNNNTSTAANASNPTTVNNQTQTVAVQQQHSNNNSNNINANNNNSNNNSYQNAGGGQIFNPQLQSANVYVPTHGIPAHHPHQQQPGAMYQAMIPTAIPSNVYVNNVTANVNLHGWAHTVPHGPWVHPTAGSSYIHGDLPPEQAVQTMGAMPVTNATIMSGGTRGSRRGRGRGAAGGARRGDYNMQRQSQQEGSPIPQQLMSASHSEMTQPQQAQANDHQQIMTSYVPHPQYSAPHMQQYPFAYPTFFSPQHQIMQGGQSAAAQHATGTPLYFSAMPLCNPSQIYNYGYYVPHLLNQADYQYGDDIGMGDERQMSAEGGAMLWHPQPQIYADGYTMGPADMHAVSADDINHNASSIGSPNETPTMLSPNYSMYEQMTHQMGEMQIFDESQVGQIQVMSAHDGIPQLDEELSDCSSQPSASMQMVLPIQMVPNTVPPAMTLQAVTSNQIIQHQHIDEVVMPIDVSITPKNTVHHQIYETTHEVVANIPSLDSVTLRIEEFVPQQIDKLESEYLEQPLQLRPQLDLQYQTVLTEMEQSSDDYSNQNAAITDVQEMKESNCIKPSVTTIVTTSNVHVAMESPKTVVNSNKQQQKSQEKHFKQFASKQNISQQQLKLQYKQQLPTTPMVLQEMMQQRKQQRQQQQPHEQQRQQQTVPAAQLHLENNYQHHQQQQHYQTNQQPFENRKSSQLYNQSRNRKYDYHYNNSNENASQQQQQQQSQQTTTKSMSWTNSSQHKKSTNSVGVTATPTTNHTLKQINNGNSPISHTHGTRTYSNQNNNNYQQQQQQQQQGQPQTRNYGAMKTPSSPISSATSTMERKTSQSTEKSQIQQQQLAQTNTALTNVTPYPFQKQSSTNDRQTQGSPANSNTTTTAISAIPAKQQPLQYSSGFATKKHGNSGPNLTANGSAKPVTTLASSSNAIETTPSPPAINLAPPVTSTAPAPTTPSWASLFANSSNISSSTSTAIATTNNLCPTASSASSTSPATNYSKKPVAKVAPFESDNTVTEPPSAVSPGTLSYSAASAQNLPPSTAKTSNSQQELTRNSSNSLDEYSLKYSEFLTKYKSDWAITSLRPRGLTNRSNYCYINSILQALIGCSPLYNLIRSLPSAAARLCEVKTPTINAMISLMSNYSQLPSGVRLRTTKGAKGNKDALGGDLQCEPAFEPTDVYKLWNNSRGEFVEGRQEDAEEFLSYILNKLNDEMLEVIKLVDKPSNEQNGQNEPGEEDGDVWQMICNNRNKGSVTRQTDFGRTPLSEIFRGELRSRLQREGEHPTDVIQPFFTLQLNIEKAASVKEALDILVGRDQLEGVTGSKTKQEVPAWQQMNLEKLPPILILHLKWFDYRSHGCTKILKKVEFPIELRIDAKILASKKYSQKQRAYRLFAVVYHDGKEATKGHYITDVYHSGYGSWLRYDDSSVKPVNENHVLLPRAPRVPYLLCYRRCDTIPQQSNNNQNNPSTANSNTSSSGNTRSSSPK